MLQRVSKRRVDPLDDLVSMARILSVQSKISMLRSNTNPYILSSPDIDLEFMDAFVGWPRSWPRSSHNKWAFRNFMTWKL